MRSIGILREAKSRPPEPALGNPICSALGTGARCFTSTIEVSVASETKFASRHGLGVRSAPTFDDAARVVLAGGQSMSSSSCGNANPAPTDQPAPSEIAALRERYMADDLEAAERIAKASLPDFPTILTRGRPWA
jgi:hypothetical protein